MGIDNSLKKIIPCLDTKDGKLVKGVGFENIKEIGNPTELARYYNDTGADELVLYDIGASIEGRTIFSNLINEIANTIDIPLIIGGGINTIEDCKNAFKSGADKISINSGAIKNYGFLIEAVKIFGSEKIILSVDINSYDGEYYIYSMGGKKNTGIKALDWLKKGEESGVGAIVVNSIRMDGVKNGFDIELLDIISKHINTPLIASGGAGKIEDFIEVFVEVENVTAGLAASVFHYKEIEINSLKNTLKENNIKVRIKGD